MMIIRLRAAHNARKGFESYPVKISGRIVNSARFLRVPGSFKNVFTLRQAHFCCSHRAASKFDVFFSFFFFSDRRAWKRILKSSFVIILRKNLEFVYIGVFPSSSSSVLSLVDFYIKTNFLDR